MTDDIVLAIDDIDVFHGTFQALWNVSIEVRRGEMLALIGANTAGKTTLLDAISGILHPAKGVIRFLGHEIEGSIPTRSWNWASRKSRRAGTFFPR